jgi:ketosteroid isomerase-like protein
MKNLCLVAVLLTTVGMAAQAAPARLDCSSLMNARWDAAQRAAALADCEFYNASIERGADAWSDFAAATVATAGVRGRDELREKTKKRYALPGFRLSWKVDRAEHFGENYVVTSGRWELHQTDNGKDVSSQGRYVTVWQKQSDGTWRYVWDGGEQDEPAKP